MLKQKEFIVFATKSENLQKIIRNYKYDFIAVSLAIVIGVTLSIMPHILWFFQTGDPTWVADNDDILYLGIASNAYHNHPAYLSDPVLFKGGSTVLPWVQAIPGIIFTKILGLLPIHTNIIWRLWAGISISVGWYLLSRTCLKNPWTALAVTVILMTDIGINSCSLIFKHFVTASNIAAGNPGTLLQTNPKLLVQWRIITPGMSFAYLLVHVWLLRLALIKPTRTIVTLAAISFGLLFYVYFYYWTAATIALLIAILIDSKNRKTYFQTGILGIIIGLPQLLFNALLKNNSNQEWLPRNDFFLSIPHWSEFLLPKLALCFLLITLFWVFWKRKDLICVWTLAASGILLTNHQIFSGLQIQNFHWNHCYGPLISFLIIVFAIESLSLISLFKKPLLFGCIALSSLYLTTGIWLRSVEAMQTKESVDLTTNYHKYYQQRFQNSNLPLDARAVVGGDKAFIDFTVIMENQRPLSGYLVDLSPAVDNAEWDARIALNSYIEGKDRDSFTLQQRAQLTANQFGPWKRDRLKFEERIQNRLKYFDEIVADPIKALKKFQVKYVALPKNTKQPTYLQLGWKLLQDGPYWQIWENKQ